MNSFSSECPLRQEPEAADADWLEMEEFYNAMQGYRHAPGEDQREVVAHFENVKRLIRCGLERAQLDAYADGRRDEREAIALDAEAS